MTEQSDLEKLILKLKETNKSHIFLYPILQLDKKIKPIETYLGFKGFEQRSSLVCLFHKDESYLQNLKLMKKHHMYDIDFEESSYAYVIFDFSRAPTLYNAVKTGKYSSIEGNAKNILVLNGGKIIQLGLNPELFYEDFAVQFECSEEDLISNGDLVSPPDINSEYINVNPTLRKEIEESY